MEFGIIISGQYEGKILTVLNKDDKTYNGNVGTSNIRIDKDKVKIDKDFKQIEFKKKHRNTIY